MIDIQPRIGFGTYQNTDPEECARSVKLALDGGYRHIDTAQIYENEQAVGRGIERSAVDRDDVFLATKLWPGDLARDRVFDAVEESLNRLGTSYLDALYVHWPAKDYDPDGTLSAFAELANMGVVEHVGVSNFTRTLLAEATKSCNVPVTLNQVEFHPLLQQDDLLTYCQREDIALVAYSPLAQGGVFDVPEIKTVAEKHGVSEAQVTLAWHLRKDAMYPIPKATSEAHMRDNLGAQDLELDQEDVERIESIDRTNRIADRDWVDW